MNVKEQTWEDYVALVKEHLPHLTPIKNDPAWIIAFSNYRLGYEQACLHAGLDLEDLKERAENDPA